MKNFQTNREQLIEAGYEEIKQSVFHRILSNKQRFHIYLNGTTAEIHFDRGIHKLGTASFLYKEIERIHYPKKEPASEWMKIISRTKCQTGLMFSKKYIKRRSNYFTYIKCKWWHKLVIRFN